jgi:hypothetical protein
MGESSQAPGFLRQYFSENHEYSVLVEDDGRVSYAYLLDADGKICGDVWLYNRCLPPNEPEWTDREEAPYANAAAYIDDAVELTLPASADEILIEWDRRKDQCLAAIFVRAKLVAKVGDGTKPGWSVLAAKDGPLAKVLK